MPAERQFMDKYKDEYEDEVSRHDAEVARAVAARADPAPPGDHTMSDTTPLYSPTLHPFAAAYAAASEGECRAARQQWVASDEERGYQLTADLAVGLRCTAMIPPPPRESPLRCRPSELQHRLDQWARTIAAELEPQTATYWLICRAYPVHPRPKFGFVAESILAIQPEAPSCLQSMAHDWRVVDPSVHECSRCGLRHEHHARLSSRAPWPWENYGWSGGDCDYDDGGTGVGDEMEIHSIERFTFTRATLPPGYGAAPCTNPQPPTPERNPK